MGDISGGLNDKARKCRFLSHFHCRGTICNEAAAGKVLNSPHWDHENSLNLGFSISEYISLTVDNRKRKQQRCLLSWRPNSRKVPRGLEERSLRRKQAGLLSGPRYKQLSHWLLAGFWAAAHKDSRGAGAKRNTAMAVANGKRSRMHKNRQHDVQHSGNNKGLQTPKDSHNFREVHTFYDFAQLCFWFL